MDPLIQTGVKSLMDISTGRPDMIIGIIDGPIDLSHKALKQSRIRTVKRCDVGKCHDASSLACKHGTFVTGVLSAERGSMAPGICPSCDVRVYPIFPESEHSSNNMPTTTAQELTTAIIETVKSGAKIINLSLAVIRPSAKTSELLQDAYEYSAKNGSIIVLAAGNEPDMGFGSTFGYPWLIPVTACDEVNVPIPRSHLGRSIGKLGIMAPGRNITSILSGGSYTVMSGTSVAAPFVTGAIALLWSIFPESKPQDLINSVRGPANRHSVVPPMLNAKQALKILAARR